MEKILYYLPFIETAKNYTLKKLRKDIIAGLTVAIIALPQSMAYAMIAGVHPKYGLYAAIVPVLISSLFGSSRFLIAGPTNAISMVVASSMAAASIAGVSVAGMPDEQKISILFLLTFMVGIIQLGMGLARTGKLLNFISHSVIIGFTAGAGILIAFNQLKNFFGIKIPNTTEFFETAYQTFLHISETNLVALGVGVFTIIFILISKKISKKIPGPLLAMIISAIITAIFGLDQYGLKVIGSIPQTLPPFSKFSITIQNIRGLASPALAIAVLGLIEALSIAKSLANKAGDKVDGSLEFFAQGLANIGASFTSAIPGSGSFTRSAVNFSAGAGTRFAGILSAIFVLLTLLLFAPYAKYIPIASLAAILIVIAYGMVDKKAIAFSYKATRSDRAVLIVTFLSTILLDLEVAVFVGVILSIALFLRKLSAPHVTKVCPRPLDNKFMPCTESCCRCPQVLIFDIFGALFFGAIEELENELASLEIKKESVILVRMKGVRILDATGAHALEKFLQDTKTKGILVIFTNIKESVMKTLTNSGLLDEIGKGNITKDTTDAVKMIVADQVNKEICTTCITKVFRECK